MLYVLFILWKYLIVVLHCQVPECPGKKEALDHLICQLFARLNVSIMYLGESAKMKPDASLPSSEGWEIF